MENENSSTTIQDLIQEAEDVISSTSSESDDETEEDINSEIEDELSLAASDTATFSVADSDLDSLVSNSPENTIPDTENPENTQNINNNNNPSSNSTKNNTNLTENSDYDNNNIPSIEERMCWICLSPNEYSELDDTDKLNLKNYSPWIHPCKCKGTQAWVHQACLRRWIDMKQEGDLMKKVKCSQCKYVYHFSRPPMTKVVKYGRRMVDISQTVSMLGSAATVGSGVIYFISGIGTVIATRVCGQKQIVRLSREHPVKSFLGFTCIVPTLLVARRSFQWEAPAMRFVAKFTEKTAEEYRN